MASRHRHLNPYQTFDLHMSRWTTDGPEEPEPVICATCGHTTHYPTAHAAAHEVERDLLARRRRHLL